MEKETIIDLDGQKPKIYTPVSYIPFGLIALAAGLLLARKYKWSYWWAGILSLFIGSGIGAAIRVASAKNN